MVKHFESGIRKQQQFLVFQFLFHFCNKIRHHDQSKRQMMSYLGTFPEIYQSQNKNATKNQSFDFNTLFRYDSFTVKPSLFICTISFYVILLFPRERKSLCASQRKHHYVLSVLICWREKITCETFKFLGLCMCCFCVNFQHLFIFCN